MKTTATKLNIDKANRLLELRQLIKTLSTEEKELKDYFKTIMGESNSLVVNTAILFSRKEITRSSYDAKAIDFHLDNLGLDKSKFKKQSTYSTLSFTKVG